MQRLGNSEFASIAPTAPPAMSISLTPAEQARIAIAFIAIALPLLLALCPWLLTNAFSSNYLPHGFCFSWNPKLLWLNVVSDSVIWLSYSVIALLLVYFAVITRRQMRFQQIFIAFGAFIVACGFTHFMDVVVLWKPYYWLSGDIKLITAAASLITAVSLPFYIPRVKKSLQMAATCAESERRFRAATESSLDSFYILGSMRNAFGEIVDFRFLFVNSVGARLLRREAGEIVGRALCELIPVNRTDGYFDKYRRVAETGESFVEESAIDNPDVNASWLRYQVIKLDDGVALTVKDISARKLLEAERARSFAESLISSSPATVILTDTDYTITAINPAAEKMLWYKSNELVGRKKPTVFYDRSEVAARAHRLSIERGAFVSPEEAIFCSADDHECEGEWTFVRNGGLTVSVQVTVTPLKSAAELPTGFMITAYDISERKRREEYISHVANHDILTGLPTRQLLMDRLSMTLARAERFSLISALIMIDLDNFKRINDSFGHHIGDALLIQIAKRLHSAIRATDTLARMGGDEFIVLISDLHSTDSAEFVAKKLLRIFEEPFLLNELLPISMTASLGVCIHPEGASDAEGLLKNADIAMYRAKNTTKNAYQIFSKEVAQLAVQRIDIANALDDALERNEFELHYQPQMSIADGALIGVEALLRWNSQRIGPVEPSRFIPLAEQSGRILPIGVWVIGEACRQLGEFQQHSSGPFIMAINISARQLEQTDLLQVIENALAVNRLQASCLEIEITESTLMSDSPAAAHFFEGLRKLGVRVAIDDFGTGFSSMSYLLRFPIDRLKIDRCFIQNCPSDPNSATVTRAIIGLAHELKASVVAEGVESEDQIAFLRAAGCDDMQGYFICRPVPAASIFPLMTAERFA